MGTALYLRLSNDDGINRESNSISNQRDILTHYANENGFTDLQEYVDDGYSGILFARPAFQRMITDIEEGKIHTALVKDLSRFGRNNTLVSYYLDVVFPDYNARLIAVDDNIDTQMQTDGLVVNIKSILNEMYVKEASKKVRSAHRQIAERGEFMAKPPYGYIKRNKKLVVDPETASNVPIMFQMAADLCIIDEISNKLGMTKGRIMGILKNPAYLGDTVSFRHGTISFKVDAKIPESEWVIKRGTHEALIDEELFKQVQERPKGHLKRIQYEAAHSGGLFDGVVYCAVCGNGLLSLAEGRYRCPICFQLTIDDNVLLNSIISDIEKQKDTLETLPDELAKIRKDESSIHAELRQAIENDEPDEIIVEIQRRRNELEFKTRIVEDALEYARCVVNIPTPITRDNVRSLIEKVMVRHNQIEIKYMKG
jgi:DNA invertase Pin-like site-specific DNA recombinase